MQITNNKRLNLSIIYTLNKLIPFLFYEFSVFINAILLSVLIYFIPEVHRLFTLNVIVIVIFVKLISTFLTSLKSPRLLNLDSIINDILFIFILTSGYNYFKTYNITNNFLNSLFILWIISLLVTYISKKIQNKLFYKYLLKNILNQDYLHSSETTILNDINIKDPKIRLNIINENLIKTDYKDIVVLSNLTKLTETLLKDEVYENIIYNFKFKLYPIKNISNIYFNMLDMSIKK